MLRYPHPCLPELLRSTARTLAALLLAAALPAAWAAPGALDPTFGSGGIVRTGLSGSPDEGNALALQPDGRIVVAGSSYNGQNYDFAVVRLNADGTLDTGFGGTGRVTTPMGAANDFANALAIDAAGRIVVAGTTFNGTNTDFALVRYNADGTLDTTFNGTGMVTTPIAANNDFANALAIDAAGRIVVAGSTFNGTNYDFAVARYNADGTLDTTFNGTGKATTPVGTGDDFAVALAIDAAGRIVAAGSSYNGANHDFALVRYNADGTPDTAFNATGKVTTPTGAGEDRATALAIDAAGRILAAGRSHNGTSDDFALVRYNADGSLDTNFNGTGKVTTIIGTGHDQPFALALDALGRIVVAGQSFSGSNWDFALARYLDNGALDTSLSGTGKLTFATGSGNDVAHGVAMDGAGRMVLAGTGGEAGADFAVARVLPDGSLDGSFGAGGIQVVNVSSYGGEWNALARQLDGKLVAVASVGNVFALVRYNTDGTFDSAFNGGGKVLVDMGIYGGIPSAIAVDANGRIVVAGTQFTAADSDFVVLRFNANGTPDTTFNGTGRVTTPIGAGNDFASVLAIDAGGRIVVAGRSFNGANHDFALARYHADGTLDTTFNVIGMVTTPIGAGNDSANAIAIDAAGRIVVAGSSFTGANHDFALARYNEYGFLDTTFNGTGMLTFPVGGGASQATALVIDAAGRIVAAGQAHNGTNDDFAVVRLDANGSLDTTFNGTGKVLTDITAGIDLATALAIDAAGRIVVAGYGAIGVNSDFALARYNADGTPDTTVNGTGKVTTPIGTANDRANALVLQPDGKAVVAGTSTGGPAAAVLVRYLMEQSPAAFAFTPQTGVALSSQATSNAIAVSGVTGFVPISVGNGQYSIGCSDPYTNSPGLVNDGAQVCVRHVSAPQPGASVSTTLTVGTTSAVFTSTTGKASSASSVASSANPSSVQAFVTFTATVGGSFGAPTGLVTFRDGAIVLGAGTLDASGQATLAISSLVIGSHSITASYAGDGTYNASVSPALDQVVSGAALAVAAASSNTTVTYGTLVTFTATLSPAPGGGFVFFYDGNNFIGADSVTGTTATFATRALAVGPHSITAEYVGGGLYGASLSPPLSQTVTAASSTTVVGSSASPGNLGSPVTFTGLVSGPGFEFGGTMAFRDGGATIAGCAAVPVVNQIAACSSAMLAAGPHAITAVYSGDTNNLGSTSPSLAQEIAYDPLADADRDSIPNGVEFAVGRDPLAKDNDVFSPGAASARLFAMQQYRDFLNREGEPAGIAGWTSLVTDGTYSRNQVIDAFLGSQEFAGFVAPVVRLYFAAFLRVPDYAGLSFNAGLVRAGTVTPAQLADYFAASPEFQAAYGSLDDAAFVTLLYGNVLGRAPDAAGLSAWAGLIQSGYTRGQVLIGFSDSAEYQARVANEVFVTMMYAGMLRRTPEPAGFDGWVQFLDNATYTREQVIGGFFLSTEYRGRLLP